VKSMDFMILLKKEDEKH